MMTEEEMVAVRRFLGEMRRKAEANESTIRAGKHFLPTKHQMDYYKVHVCTYHSYYIAGRNVSHKLCMLHYAAIYEVIARMTGIKDGKFWGPEYDRFLIDHCQLKYNKSDDNRGRFRQVKDVYKRYGHGIPNRDTTAVTSSKAKGKEKMQGLYDSFVNNFRRIADSRPVKYGQSHVPEKLDDTNG